MKNKQSESKIRFSVKIYPLLNGFNTDLIFWVIIESLFLTEIKHLTATQINFLISFSTIVALCLQPFLIPVIGRLGNLKSMRFGLFLMLCSMIILTFGNRYYWILFGYVIYVVSFLFKDMEGIILRKNLSYFSEEDNFMLIKNKGSLIYSVITAIIALFAGPLFNVNKYLPSLYGIVVCMVNFILSFLVYECDSMDTQKQETMKAQFKLNKVVLVIFVLYGILYAIINIGQQNCSLMIKYSLTEFLSPQKMATGFTTIIALSRVSRIAGNYLVLKLYKKFRKVTMSFMCISTITALIFILIGSLVGDCIQGVLLIACGLFIFLSIRDLVSNHLTTVLLNHCDSQIHYKASSYLNLSRKIGQFTFSSVFTLLLLKADLFIVMVVSLINTIFALVIALKFRKELV